VSRCFSFPLSLLNFRTSGFVTNVTCIFHILCVIHKKYEVGNNQRNAKTRLITHSTAPKLIASFFSFTPATSKTIPDRFPTFPLVIPLREGVALFLWQITLQIKGVSGHAQAIASDDETRPL
jgi:hypothetical protein